MSGEAIDWHPMSTATRDGDRPKHVFLLVEGQERPGFWFGAYGWIMDVGHGERSERFKQCRPSAWRPTAPATEQ